MCIWDCEIRRCEYCSFEPCFERAVKEKLTSDDYIRAMEEVTGLNIRDRHKPAEMVWARNMVAYQMFLDGYNHSEIADAIGKHRCTIIYAIGKVQDMLDMPSQYPKEMAVWRKFKKSLSLQQKL